MSINIQKQKRRTQFVLLSIGVLFISIVLLACTSVGEKALLKKMQKIRDTFVNMTAEEKDNYVCDFKLLVISNGDCGFERVPADYNNPDGETVQVFWYHLKAKSSNPSRNTLVLLTGGPGQSNTSMASSVIVTLMSKLQEHSDVFGVDYRGTGHSDPYDEAVFNACSNLKAENPNVFPQEAFEKCKKAVDNSSAKYDGLSTENFVRDLDFVLAKKDIDNVVLYGVSYGTRVAITAARDVPERIGAIVLDGVFPIEVMGLSQSSDAPLQNLDYFIGEYREQRDTLPAEFGDIEQRITMLAKKIVADNYKKETLEYINTIASFTYDKYRYVIADKTLSFFENNQYKEYQTFKRTLSAYPFMDAGDYQLPPEGMDSMGILLHRDMAMYMSNAVILKEEFAMKDKPYPVFSSLDNLNEDIKNAFKNYIGGAEMIFSSYEKAQEILQIEPANEIESMKVVSDIPTIIFNGTRDLYTPMSWARKVNKDFTNAKLIEYTQGDHGFVPVNKCAVDIVDKFIISKDSSNVDTACFDESNQEQENISNNASELDAILQKIADQIQRYDGIK